MWESMHLFSRYAKNHSVSSTSSLENTVSAYTTVNEAVDSMTVIIVNRDMSTARNVTVNLSGFTASDGSYSTRQLASLPSTETFKSHTNNALKTSSVAVASNSFSISVPALSTTAVLLQSATTGIGDIKKADKMKIFPNPATDQLNVSISSNVAEPTQISISNQSGQKIQSSRINYDGFSTITVNLSSLSDGFYLLSVKNTHCASTKSFTIIK
jgi:hypothetical protein